MCGLVTIINNDLFKPKIKDFVEQALIVNSLRGTDSTGIFSVNKKGECLYYKKVLPGWDFIQLNTTEEVMNVSNIRFVVGHNRSATRGVSTKLEHAHPVLYNGIILVHNGTLNNVFELNRGLSTKESSYHDSTAIAMSIARRGPIETLEMLEGAYALIWYNIEEGTLNFARNTERTLYMCQEDKNNGWFAASEAGMLKWLADRNSIGVKQIALLKEGLLLTVPLDSKYSIQRIKFKVRETKRFNQYPENDDYTRHWWNYGYSPTEKGEVFRAIFLGRQMEKDTGKFFLRFKRPGDSAWGWKVWDSKDANNKVNIIDSEHMLKALEERKTGDTNNKLAEITTEQPNLITSRKYSYPPNSSIDKYENNEEVEFIIMDMTPSRKGGGKRVTIRGVTTDDAGVEVRLYNVELEKYNISVDNLYKSVVTTKVFKHQGGRTEEYLILNKDSIKECFIEGETCSWCDSSLTAVGGRVIPELGVNAALCGQCLKLYNHYAERE